MSLLAFVLGAAVGSFLNVCIARWPHGASVVRPRSRCLRCARPITWYDNLPIASWVMLRGRCRGCGGAIALRYPIIELLVGLLWLGSAQVWGPTVEAFRVAVTSTLLLGIAVTDLTTYLIPDGFTVTGLLFALGSAAIAFVLGSETIFAGPWHAVLGACVGAGAIAIVAWLGEVVLQKEAMGQGDVTLMAFVGAMVGPERSLLTIFVAAALASVLFLAVVMPIGWVRARSRGEAFAVPLVPFGVFLAPAGLVSLFTGDAMIAWYLAQGLGR
jgi:leader peptidase (prepilin peptidase)/N-methyltransferase